MSVVLITQHQLLLISLRVLVDVISVVSVLIGPIGQVLWVRTVATCTFAEHAGAVSVQREDTVVIVLVGVIGETQHVLWLDERVGHTASYYVFRIEPSDSLSEEGFCCASFLEMETEPLGGELSKRFVDLFSSPVSKTIDLRRQVAEHGRAFS